jgi:hypothetical protein
MELAFASIIKYYSGSYSFETKSDATDTVLGCFYLGMIVFVPFLLFVLTNVCKESI